MKKFIATCKHTGKVLEVQADDIGWAATKAANIFNKKKNLGAIRQTGEFDMSGCFQAYTSGNPQSSVGHLFHVREA